MNIKEYETLKIGDYVSPLFGKNKGKKILEVLEKTGINEFHYEKIDNKDMYDDKKFYELTHNEDGSLNEEGKSLI